MSWTAGVAAALVAAALTPNPVFRFADPAITESSGLVDLGPLMVTTNDSGGGPLVYVVDPATGRTVGTTTFADEVTDVEALAPAGPDAVWVGDIGDNAGSRPRVQVYRVAVGRGDRTVRAPAYDLVYPDGPHDAESLVLGRDGRLRIITKGILGGRVYVAPRHLRTDRPNVLRAGAPVDLFATDAALFPDGEHVLVRGYGSAVVATFPAFTPVASFALPSQEQGEGVSISRSGRIRLSSEGVHSPVLQIRLPSAVRAAMAPAVRPAATPGLDGAGAQERGTFGARSWLSLGAGTLVVSALAGLVLRAAARRRRA
ncbi:MAG: hypothetical protein ACJ72D_03365 [Marmoricola sp.]